MGSLAKRLGQLARFRLETESANILKTTKANKIPGSLANKLDGTLKDGHDMKVFGLGTLASMASVNRYQRFSFAMYAVYSTMEQELDQTAEISEPMSLIWKQYGDTLRRESSLRQDLLDITEDGVKLDKELKNFVSPATQTYVKAIQKAGEHDRETGSATLIGHLYCRYLADLFGGQMLGRPYQLALGLERSPRFYLFDKIHNRREFIEDLYGSFNSVGDRLTEEQKKAVVKEAYAAFGHNIQVYSEEPIYMDALRGGWNISTGFIAQPFSK